MKSYVNIFPAESLAHKIYKAEQVRKVEPVAAKQAGVSMYTLMERAGQSVYSRLCKEYPDCKKLLVLAGKGNNGGDAYVVARLAIEVGISVTLCEFADLEKITGDAKTARLAWQKAGGIAENYLDLNFNAFEYCVDGLLGTGISGEVKAPISDVIEKVANAGLTVVSIDIPSGIHADSGAVCGVAIQAKHTVTFVGIKSGLVTGAGKEHTGKLHFEDLGIGTEYQRLSDSKGRVFDFKQLKPLPLRDINSHKGTYGKLLCVGGNLGMPGSIKLTGEAALRCGSGLVKIFCHPDNALAVALDRPELMVQTQDDQLQECLDWCSTVVIGPGLGRDAWAKEKLAIVMEHCAATRKSLVIDADAINLLAESPNVKLPKDLAIITPHSTEAARLLKMSTAEVEQQRYHAVWTLANQLQCVALLKGPGSIVCSQTNLWVCKNGNPGMATAGMGDVLSGVLGALLAQGMGLRLSAVYGMCLHSFAADLASQEGGERGMIASDLFPYLRNLVNVR